VKFTDIRRTYVPANCRWIHHVSRAFGQDTRGLWEEGDVGRKTPLRTDQSQPEYIKSEGHGKVSGARAGDCCGQTYERSRYILYRIGREKILPKVRELLQASVVDLSRGGGIPYYSPFSAICHSIR
jgi:hypothetical protein